MSRFVLSTMMLLFGCHLVIAGQPEQEAKDLQAIRAAVDAYVVAYNRADAKAVAQFWSGTGEWVNPSGQRITGREAIEKELQSMFAENQGLRIEVLDSSIRFVTADVAVEEGKVRVTSPGQAPSESTYIAVQVKKDGKWKLDSVRETDLPQSATASSPLKDLEWLVGDWVDQSGDSQIDASVTWTKNKTFLNYAFKAAVPGMDDLEGTQVIGWDPAAGTIRSWMFDSDGGFGEGAWSKKDNRWTVKFSQVLPDGRTASATNIYTLVDEDAFTWQSIGRQVDGEFLPNIEAVKVVRKSAIEAGKAAEKSPTDGAKN